MVEISVEGKDWNIPIGLNGTESDSCYVGNGVSVITQESRIIAYRFNDSSGSIDWGTDIVVPDSVTNYTTPVCYDPVNDVLIMVTQKSGSPTEFYVQRINISGLVLTVGARITLQTSVSHYSQSVLKINYDSVNQKMLLVNSKDGQSMEAWAIDCSSGSPVAGARTICSTGADTYQLSAKIAYSPSANKHLLIGAHRDYKTYYKYYVFTISGTTVAFSTNTVTFPVDKQWNWGSRIGVVYEPDVDRFVVVFPGLDYGASAGVYAAGVYVMAGKLVGNTFTEESPYFFVVEGATTTNIFYDDISKKVILLRGSDYDNFFYRKFVINPLDVTKSLVTAFFGVTVDDYPGNHIYCGHRNLGSSGNGRIFFITEPSSGTIYYVSIENPFWKHHHGQTENVS